MQEESQGDFRDVGCCCCFILTGPFFFSGLFFLATGTPPWLLRSMMASTSSEFYPGYFWLFYVLPGFSVTFYHKRYGFERALFNHRRFLPCAPSDAGRNTPSRIFLYACRHRIVPSSWHMVLNYSYCRYKTIGLAITSVSHEI